MRFGCQFMLAGGLVLGLGACSTTPTGDGDPNTRTVCERVSSASGSRMSRKVCREVEVKQPPGEDAEDGGNTDSAGENKP